MQAQQAVVMAEADLERARRAAEQTVVTAEAESRQRVLAGQGEAARIAEVGKSEADVLTRKVQSYGDPRLYALALVAEHLSHSSQPLVPQQVLMTGDGGGNGSSHATGGAGGALNLLMNLLVAEKLGFNPSGHAPDTNGHSTPAPAALPAIAAEAAVAADRLS
jgi:uncharacterized membrane protein YqiK